MPITCPACNKPEQSGSVCARCGCDLTQLQTLRQAASAALSEAGRCLEARLWPEALDQAERSWRLRHSAEAAQLAFLAAGALGDTDRALEWHRRGRN